MISDVDEVSTSCSSRTSVAPYDLIILDHQLSVADIPIQVRFCNGKNVQAANMQQQLYFVNFVPEATDVCVCYLQTFVSMVNGFCKTSR